MIVRDEEKTLSRCLKSVQGVADELIVVDTGSKDNTISIAKDFGAKVYHFKWCDDFAAARNESLKHATSDWILQIDADEELLSDSVPYLKSRMLRPMVLCYAIKCDNGPRTQVPRFSWVYRLFRRHPELRYHRPYHEGVDRSIQDLMIADPGWQKQHEPNIIIRHYGYEQSELHRKHEKGLQIMKYYLKENPNDAYVLTKLGDACCGLGRYHEGEAYLRKALEISPDWSKTNYSLGLTLQMQNKLDAAIRCYKKAVAADPEFAEAYGNLAGIYIGKGMFDEAISELKKALAISPDVAVGLSMLGLAYYKKGMFDKAIDQYKRVLKIDAGNADAHFNLGMVYGSKGMINETITQYKRALAINPDLAEAHLNLAVTYYAEKRYELAIKHCDRAIKLGLRIHPGFLQALKTYR